MQQSQADSSGRGASGSEDDGESKAERDSKRNASAGVMERSDDMAANEMLREGHIVFDILILCVL